jgi:hypothetical protein
MKTVNQDWQQLLKELSDILNNVEGYGLSSEIDSVLSKYEEYLAITPVPQSVAKWLNNLIELLNNCEGAGLETELKSLKLPKVGK